MEKNLNNRHTFKKSEKLTSKAEITNLFTHGESFLVFPFRVSFQQAEKDQLYPVKILIGVKKKTYKRAVKRNLIKRRGREAYRLHKHELYQWLMDKGINLHLGLIYISPDILDYDQFERAIPKIIATLKKKIGQID